MIKPIEGDILIFKDNAYGETGIVIRVLEDGRVRVATGATRRNIPQELILGVVDGNDCSREIVSNIL
ncbi:CHAP domain-containing protein [Paenibacillus sp. Mc5Re-14]|uniref:CHAP domain-containing protein n=1 Tax=Paenibacillus sp. Mc5Re-14 TaxID=1030529 RepID=UPI000B2676A7|nr:CHAP domain-containing protein [Paenibacillus sp. Mc5Re-14]